MKQVAVAVIHGMGHSDHNFADDFIDLVEKNLGSELKATVGWIPLHWADLLEGRQQRYLDNANASARLDWQDLRDFVVHTLGDAVAYQQEPGFTNPTYWKVQAKIKLAFKQAWAFDFQRRDVPLIWVANSLGSHVMSTYIWDMMHERGMVSASAFLRQETIRGIFTTGSSLPLFSFAYHDVVPVHLPEGAKWYNIYDRDDILGWPLKPINEAYDKAVTEDIQINAGNLRTCWNPLCHLDYWTDNDVVSRVADFIRETLDTEEKTNV